MKKIFFCFFTILSFSINYSQAQTTEYQLKNTLNEIIANERERHQVLNNFEITGAGTNVDIKYHRFNWKIDPSVRFISGSVTTYFRALQTVGDLAFDLDPILRVDSVIFRGRIAAFTQQTDKTLHCAIDVPSGNVDSITVYYKGVPPTTGFGSYNQRARSSSFETWTLSEPYGSRDWWPGKMDLQDKIDSIDLYVTTPPQYRVASNGLLMSETTMDANNKTYHWKHRYPIANYLIAIAVTNFVQYTDKVKLSRGDSMNILNYVYPESLTTSQVGSGQVAGSMRLFDSLFVEYPFKREKYGHAQFGWGGGMEHQTMSFMVNLTNSGLIAHELAHQWFGDMVTCGSFQDIWLNEGFATFLTGLYLQNVEPQWWRGWRVQTLRDATASTSGSVYVPASDTLDVNRVFSGGLTYSKGAYVLHTLRFKLGDSAFFAGIRNYLKDPKVAYGFARTNDLKVHLETASRQNLTEFFNDYIFGQGYPTYTVSGCQDDVIGRVNLRVQQRTSHNSVPLFELPVPIKLINKNQQKDTTIVVNLTSNDQRFTVLHRLGVVDSVAFDPELWVYSKNNSVTWSLCLTAQDIDNQWLIAIAPNPVNEKLSFAFQHQKVEDLKLEIINQIGQVVLTEKRTAAVGQNNLVLNVQNLPKGIYHLTISTAQKLASRKFIKN